MPKKILAVQMYLGIMFFSVTFSSSVSLDSGYYGHLMTVNRIGRNRGGFFVTISIILIAR